ncbi:hypothetical protein [Streptomyces sp. ISL-43]|nr:hypothetical protein [Streptomyces sp. ISL-43]
MVPMEPLSHRTRKVLPNPGTVGFGPTADRISAAIAHDRPTAK